MNTSLKANPLFNKNPFTRNNLKRFRAAVSPLFSVANEPHYVRIFLGLITLMGMTLRLYLIDRPIGYDEAYTFINFSSKSFKFILADYHAPNNHILNSLLIGIAYRLFGDHTWIVRLPAFIASSLCIPAAYLAGRRFFTASQALAAATVLAVTPTFIHEAVNGRGYSFVLLFALLLTNFAGVITRGHNRAALAGYAITGALGFYSIPIFLYPMAGISLWVLISLLIDNDNREAKWFVIRSFLIACIASGVLTLLLYSPVILFGTGLQSLIANDYVKSQTWNEFQTNLLVRSLLTWNDWTVSRYPQVMPAGIGAFILSILFYRKVSNQRLPLQIFLIIGAVVFVTAQRVAPLARVWEYLEMYFLFFAAAGLVWLAHVILNKLTRKDVTEAILSWSILLLTFALFIKVTTQTFNPQAIADRRIAPEKFAAEYLANHITTQDTIIAPSPVDLQTAYYLKLLGVSYDIFYQRGHPVKIENALVIIRSESVGKIKTLDALIEVFKLETVLDVSQAEVVFEYRPLQIISIPAYK